MKKIGKIINIKNLKKGDTVKKPLSISLQKIISYISPGVIAFIVTTALTFIISPTFRSPYPALKTGDISSKNIRAPEDTLIEDKVSTIKSKKRAEETSPDVYDFDIRLTTDITKRVSAAFDLMVKFYKGKVPELYSSIEKEDEMSEIDTESSLVEEGRKLKREIASKLSRFENSSEFRSKEREFQSMLKIELSDKNLKALRWHHYKKSIKDNISGFISQVMGIGVMGSKEFVDMDKGILLREIGTDTERILPDASSVIDIRQANELIKRLAEDSIYKENRPLQTVIANICQKLIQPNLTFNKNETEKKRREAVEREKPVFYQIKKGEMIIREGEKVTEEHILKLNALELKQSSTNYFMSTAGYSIFIMLLMYLFWRYIKGFKPLLTEDKQSLILLGLILIFNLAQSRIFVDLLKSTGYGGSVEISSYMYSIPYAVAPMLIAILFEMDIALIFSVLNSLLIGLLIKDGFYYSLVALSGGIISIYRANQHKKRSSILKTGLLIGIANALTIIPLDLINNPLLSKLVVQAPGTYHHSIIVGNLAEDAAEAIGANPLFARVASYFHDIGKMKKPEYFIENQHGNINKHDGLAPSMSSLILTSHIKDGVELARSHRLIPKIIDIIKEHHGTSLITYFYNKAKEMEDPSLHEVSEEDFRYPGPKPNTKESAIVLLADSVEAASRTLDEPTPSRLRGLVQKIIDDKFIDGQLDHSNLTLNDLHKITNSFVRILTGIFHYRIEYPEIENEKEERAGLHANNDSEPKPHEDRPKERKKVG